MGEIVPPNGGTGSYIMNGNDITWNALTKDTASVDFTFSKTIKVGNVSSDFLRTVTQPLNYVEPIRKLSFDLNGGALSPQSIKTGDKEIKIDNTTREGIV